MLDLEDLGQRRLEERGRHAHQGHDPHPEDRSGAAVHERRGHAENVADACKGLFLPLARASFSCYEDQEIYCIVP